MPKKLRVSVVDADTFWQNVDKGESCWNWQGADAGDGYGAACYQGRTWRAHRLAWVLTKGEIPAGMFVCHHCDNRRCVRPDHLWLGTAIENNLDRDAKGRNVAYNLAKEVCPKGHPYDEANTYYHPRGSRHCRACQKALREAHDKKRMQYKEVDALRAALAESRAREAALRGALEWVLAEYGPTYGEDDPSIAARYIQVRELLAASPSAPLEAVREAQRALARVNEWADSSCLPVEILRARQALDRSFGKVPDAD